MKMKRGLLLLIPALILAGCTAAATDTVPSVPEATKAPLPVSTQPADYPAPANIINPTAIAAYPEPESGSEEPEPDVVDPAYPGPVDGDSAQATDYPAPAEDSSSPVCEPLPAAPQAHAIFSDDGILLSGTFYPAANCNAPLVLLFHQYGSSSEQWLDLAGWLQNRSGELSAVPRGLLASPAKQYSWFPVMPDGLSFNVFTLDFRGHGQSKSSGESFDGAGYIVDAQNALAFARALPLVDSGNIITIGTSIGADAAAAACLAIDGTAVADFQVNQGCVGILSLSPGNYLGVNYIEMVTRLSETPFNVQVYCVASVEDNGSPDNCRADVPGNFLGIIYPDRGDHGIALFREDLDPNIGDLVLEFLLKSITVR